MEKIINVIKSRCTEIKSGVTEEEIINCLEETIKPKIPVLVQKLVMENLPMEDFDLCDFANIRLDQIPYAKSYEIFIKRLGLPKEDIYYEYNFLRMGCNIAVYDYGGSSYEKKLRKRNRKSANIVRMDPLLKAANRVKKDGVLQKLLYLEFVIIGIDNDYNEVVKNILIKLKDDSSINEMFQSNLLPFKYLLEIINTV